MALTTFTPRSFASHPAYGFLFEKLTPAEERMAMRRTLIYSATWWAAVVAHCAGICGVWGMGAILAWSVIHYNIADHDRFHVNAAHRTPFYLRCCTPPQGFLLVAGTFGDNYHNHIKDHHFSTKSVIDPHDHDSKWSKLPVPLMLLGMFLQPSNLSALEVIGYYIWGPSGLWVERAVCTILMYAQYALLHQATHAHTRTPAAATCCQLLLTARSITPEAGVAPLVWPALFRSLSLSF